MVFEIPEFEISKILLSVIIGTVIKIHLLNKKTISLAIQIYEGSEHCRNKYITSIGSLSYVEKLSDNGSSAVIR